MFQSRCAREEQQRPELRCICILSAKVVFDTDLGIDDAMALLFLHFSPHTDLVGICTGVGNAPVELTTRNCLYLKERFGIAAGVYRGAATGLNGQNPLPPPEMIHGKDGLGNIDIPLVTIQQERLDAAQYLINVVNQNPGEITLITVGRLTNLAEALQREPGIAAKLKNVVVMGGATGRNGHGGNVSPVAEANIYGDPLAADQVFRANVPLTMVGLDVTQQVVMDQAYFSKLRDQGGEVGEFIFQISRLYTQFYHDWVGVDGCYVHDASACIYQAYPHLFTVERGRIRVPTSGPACGQTIFSPQAREWFTNDWNDVPVKSVCVDVQAQDVLDRYFETLTRKA